MNLQQLRFLREAVRQNFNLTETAKSLYTSQPGVSKAIIELEEELGIEIFVRHGKRLRGLTEPGHAVLKSVEHIMLEIDSLKKISKDYAAQDSGSLTIATTHTQARYALPKVVQSFIQAFPKVRLSLLQGDPGQIGRMVLSDQADIAVASELLASNDGLRTLPCYQWSHVLIAPAGHPILQCTPLTLEEITRYPLITYDMAYSGRSRIEQAFQQRNLKPDIVLEAIDADVIKTYVELGLGIGIISELAYQPERDPHLRALPAGHLFGTNVARIAVKQGAYLRSFIYTFIELLATHLGDARTLALPIAHTVFFASGPEMRAKMGITDSLIRVSTGIEDTEDLLEDFKQALSRS